MEVGHPLALLSMASSFAELAADSERARSMLSDEPGERPPPVTWETICDLFLEVDFPEITALLHALAPFAPEPWVSQIRLQLELRRLQPLPSWVRSLEKVQVTEAWEQGDVLGDGENLLLGARWSTGDELTAVTYVDHNVGGLVKDFFTGLGPPGEIVDVFEDQAPRGAFQHRLDLADARARIDDAVERWATTWPPFVSEEWPIARPLLLWLASHMPEGGQSPRRVEMSEDDRDRLIDAFLTSADGAEVRDEPVARLLTEAIVQFGAEQGVRDPLRWSGVRIEVLLLDFLPRTALFSDDASAMVPTVLEGFVPWALVQLGIRDGIDMGVIDERVVEALDALDYWAPRYLELMGADPDGDWDGGGWDEDEPLDLDGKSAYEMATALLATAGDEMDDETRAHLAAFIALGPDPSDRDYLLFELGGEEAAAQVHGEPWPLEQLDRSAVPEDLLHTVDEIDALLAVACAQLQFDEEHLTIARRLLTRLAQHDPKALRRPAATGGWVAGLIVAVGDLNGLIGQSRGRVTKKAIAAAAGVKSVGSKDMTVGRGARLSTKYHHVDLLDSRNRTELLELLAEST